MITALSSITRSRALLLSLALQVAILGAFVSDRIGLLRSATEIVLPVRPVDPRDLFRGDYVTLAYDISRAAITPDQRARLDATQPFFVVIRQDAAGSWSARVAGDTRPAAQPGETVLKARAQSPEAARRGSGDAIAVRYGLESYFIPEGTGRQLEQLARDRKLAVVAAIGPNGDAAIKGLMVDGQLTWREPAF